MVQRPSLTLILVLLLSAASFAFPILVVNADNGVWYAKPEPTGTGDCLLWADACTLQSALAAAEAGGGGEIWVMAGTHWPTGGSDRNATFQLRSGVAVYGGFTGTEDSFEQRDLSDNETILSGDIGALADTSDNAFHVVTGSGTDSTAVLDGFTVTGGYAFDDYGGGLFINNGSPSLSNVTFTANTAAYGGGGMFIEGGSPTLSNVTFSGNTTENNGGGIFNNGNLNLTNVDFSGNWARFGGGLFNESDSTSSLTDVTFSGNSADFGGGLYTITASSTSLTDVTFENNEGYASGGGFYNNGISELTNVVFSNNSASTDGGGMYNVASSPILKNVTFQDNSAQVGGGLSNRESSPSLTNVTFESNSASSIGGGMANRNLSSPVLNYVIFANNTAQDDGGGLANVNQSSPLLTGVTFMGNLAVYDGGGMSNLVACHPMIVNATFYGNIAGNGGGMMNRLNSSPTLTNTTFRGNSALGLGGGMGNFDSSSPTIWNSIFWGNSADIGPEIFIDSGNVNIESSIVQGGCPDQGMCGRVISSDPLLGTIGNWSGGVPGIPLLPGSPAINTGWNPACPEEDSRGILRNDGYCDMGSFESRGFTLAVISGNNQHTLIGEPFADPLNVGVSSIFDEPVNGGKVTFLGPETGPGISPLFADVPIVLGQASQVFSANSESGAYAVNVSAGGEISPAFFDLSNDVVHTTTTIASSDNPSRIGYSVTFTVTVQSEPDFADEKPTGTVELIETTPGSPPIVEESGSTTKELVNGEVQFTVSGLSAGQHSFIALYEGEQYFVPSSSNSLTQIVKPYDCYLPLIVRIP